MSDIWMPSRRGFLAFAAASVPFSRLRADDENTKFSADVKVVTMMATVKDKKGQIIRNLRKEDFELKEDGRAQNIQYFSQQTDQPLTFGLLADTSTRQRMLLGQERDASFTFVEQVLREDKDRGFVIHFDREVELLQDLTGSRKKLEDALNQMNASVAERPQMQRPNGGGGNGGGYPGGGGGGYPGGRGGGYPAGGQRGGGSGGQRRMVGSGTKLYDSILLASDEVMKPQSGRKALILLTSGVDQGSKVGKPEAIAAAQKADTAVYSILFVDKGANSAYQGRPGGGYGGGGRRGGGMGRMPPSSSSANLPDGKKILQSIAQETGGSFFEVSSKHPLDKIYAEIEEELRSQYSLGYKSDSTAGPGYRRIELTTRGKDQVVQTRPGYYAKS